MARKGITVDQVEQAVNAIESRGDTATMAAIRQELGGGSMTTISSHLKELRSGSAEPKQLNEVQLPDTLKRMSGEILEAFWKTAVDIATDDVEAIRKSAGARVDALYRELEEAYEAIKILDAELMQSKEDLERTSFELVKLKDEYMRSEARLTELKALHEEKNTQLEQHMERLEGVLLKVCY